MAKYNDLFTPAVLKPIVAKKIASKLQARPFMVEDNSLMGIPGDSVIVRKYQRKSGSAKGGKLAEGAQVSYAEIEKVETPYKVSKWAEGFKMTDEELAYGEDGLRANLELLADDMAHMLDDEFYKELAKGTAFGTDIAEVSYANVIKVLGKFEDEGDEVKYLFINPKDYETLCLDPMFTHASALGDKTIVSGRVGEVAGCMVIRSRKVPAGKIFVMKQGAVTLFNKVALKVESQREIDTFENKTAASQHFVVALTDASKVIVATITQA